jgi:hypothetical protein
MAIYRPSFLSPASSTVDMTEVNTFTAQINGTKATSYKVLIYKLDNTLIHDSGQINLSPYLYDKQTLSYNVPVIAGMNGQQLKWTLTTYEGINLATSRETPFYAYTTPTVTMTVPATITENQYTFDIVYTQTESIDAQKWKLLLYDSTSTLLEDTGWNYGGELKYTFSVFTNGESYKIKAIVINQADVEIESSLYSFTVTYSAPNTTIVPTTTLLCDESAIQIDWYEPVQSIGVVTGQSAYIDNFMITNNHGLALGYFDYATTTVEIVGSDTGLISSDGHVLLAYSGVATVGTAPAIDSKIEFDIETNDDFTANIVYQPAIDFVSGVLVEMYDDAGGVTYAVGYDGERFYFENDGILISGTPMNIPKLPFLIAMRSQDVVIVYNYEVIEHLKGVISVI